VQVFVNLFKIYLYKNSHAFLKIKGVVKVMILKKISHNISEICLDLKESIFNWMRDMDLFLFRIILIPKKKLQTKHFQYCVRIDN